MKLEIKLVNSRELGQLIKFPAWWLLKEAEAGRIPHYSWTTKPRFNSFGELGDPKTTRMFEPHSVARFLAIRARTEGLVDEYLERAKENVDPNDPIQYQFSFKEDAK
ncbi:MAG: hypothetical protein GY952_12025 [Rhodobacteraceae bacterium]|nr:hypothetical protein [Paracoccaceae bacterium]